MYIMSKLPGIQATIRLHMNGSFVAYIVEPILPLK